MFGIRYFRAKPTSYVLLVRNGRIRREGAGLSFFYGTRAHSVVTVPMSSRVDDFIHTLTTADFQTVTVQGQVTWRIAEPKRTAALVDFTVRADGKGYETDDPLKLPQRVLTRVENLTQKAVQQRPLKEALLAADAIAAEGLRLLSSHAQLQALGLEILGFVVTAVRPTPETARALEAEARETILKRADDAIFMRRNAAVENERAIRESELDTEVAVEQKKRQIKETQMDAEASLRRKNAELRQADMETEIALETRRRDFVATQAQNTRTLAEAEAHKVAAVMAALERADVRVIQALAAAGMAPGQLIAQAFGGLAERAERIGQLNVSPDLLETLLTAGSTASAAAAGARGMRSMA
jgi:hypothetical protein